MKYRLNRCIRITPVHGDDEYAVLVDSRDFSAHRLNVSGYHVVRALVTLEEADVEAAVAEMLSLDDENARSYVNKFVGDLVDRGWLLRS